MKPIYIILSIITILLASCTKEIDLNTGDTFTRLSVDGVITTDTIKHLVRLSQSVPVNYPDTAMPVIGATVKITDGIDTFLLTEERSGNYYTDTMAGKIGMTYTLIITNVDIDNDGVKEIYTAQNEIRPIAPCDFIGLFYTNFGPVDTVFAIMLFAQDPPTREFYAFKSKINGISVTDRLSDYYNAIQEDSYFNGNYTNGVWVQFLFQNDERQKVKGGDTVTFELNSINEDYYLYLSEVTQAMNYNPLFGGPPTEVRSNISCNFPEKKPVGYFTAYSTSYASTIVPPGPWEKDKAYNVPEEWLTRLGLSAGN